MPDGAIAVTGSSRGIGAAIAIELAARGFTVACLSRAGGLPENAPEGGPFICAPCDVTDEASIRAALAAAVKETGKLRGLVNNAGVHRETESSGLATDDFEDIMRTNATSVMMVSREAYPHLKAAGGGRIVNIGSFFDKIGVSRNLAYCASKAAVGAITRCLAAEWARDGITVMNVAPGYIETDLNRDTLQNEKFLHWLKGRSPAARPGTPQEVARLVASLYGEDNAFLTGETIYIDGGQSMAL
jgi:NAD(P)-dependent dehydrogenase (short-subunit alcohol dehydrogenase family)